MENFRNNLILWLTKKITFVLEDKIPIVETPDLKSWLTDLTPHKSVYT